jgi:hypothetical protein
MTLNYSLPLLGALLLAGEASADVEETYLQIASGPALLLQTDAATNSTVGAALPLGAELTGYYGVTDQIHLGIAARFQQANGARVDGVRPTIDGAAAGSGQLFQDVRGIGGGFVFVYRFDTLADVAPFVRAELGATHFSYERLRFVPEGASFAFELPGSAQLVPSARAVGGVEYRFGNQVLASIGLSVRKDGFGAGWQFELPIALGFIW